jgi:hypothetical protein
MSKEASFHRPVLVARAALGTDVGLWQAAAMLIRRRPGWRLAGPVR